MKTLVAYFSHDGQTEMDHKIVDLDKGLTEIVAEKIANLTGADLYKIEPVNKYPKAYEEIVRRARDEHEENKTIEILNPLENINDYDVIYLGFPIWYRTYPRIVASWLKSLDFTGKTVRPFCTNDEGFFGISLLELQDTLTNANITGGLSIIGSMVNDSDERIEKFVNEK